MTVTLDTVQLPTQRSEPEADRTPLTDDNAFDAAVVRTSQKLLRYARRRLSPHDSEDVVQEALARACQRRDSFATEADLAAWSMVVTAHLTVDRVRAEQRVVTLPDVETSRRVRDTADLVVAKDATRLALKVLGEMPTRQAGVLWAREIEGLSYDDIGARYAMSEAAVRSLLHRARQTLRRDFVQRGGSLPAVFPALLSILRRAGKLAVTGAPAATVAAIVMTAPVLSTASAVHPHAAAVRPAHTSLLVHVAPAVPKPHVRRQPPTHDVQVTAKPMARHLEEHLAVTNPVTKRQPTLVARVLTPIAPTVRQVERLLPAPVDNLVQGLLGG
jgi:RNA polymerase sigma-70 factor (ECF subfamily)